MTDAPLMEGASALRNHVVGRAAHRLIDGEQHIKLRRCTTSHVPSKKLELDGHRIGILPYQLGQHGKCRGERLGNRSGVGKAGGSVVPYSAARLRSQGRSDGVIRSQLMKEGYSEEDIREILKNMNR